MKFKWTSQKGVCVRRPGHLNTNPWEGWEKEALCSLPQEETFLTSCSPASQLSGLLNKVGEEEAFPGSRARRARAPGAPARPGQGG